MLYVRWYLWIAPEIILAICLVGLLRRERPSRLPVFLSYVIFELAQSVILISLNSFHVHHKISLTSYDWGLLITTGIELILELAVLAALAEELILTRASIGSSLRSLLRGTAACLLLVAAATSALFSQPGLQRVMKIFQTLDFSANLIIIGLLLALLLFSRVLHISWRSLPTGIALGFGVYAGAEIAASSLLSLLGRSFKVDLVRMAAYHMCVVVWLVYIFFRPEAPAMPAKGLKSLELETWDHELERMVHPWSRL